MGIQIRILLLPLPHIVRKIGPRLPTPLSLPLHTLRQGLDDGPGATTRLLGKGILHRESGPGVLGVVEGVAGVLELDGFADGLWRLSLERRVQLALHFELLGLLIQNILDLIGLAERGVVLFMQGFRHGVEFAFALVQRQARDRIVIVLELEPVGPHGVSLWLALAAFHHALVGDVEALVGGEVFGPHTRGADVSVAQVVVAQKTADLAGVFELVRKGQAAVVVRDDDLAGVVAVFEVVFPFGGAFVLDVLEVSAWFRQGFLLCVFDLLLLFLFKLIAVLQGLLLQLLLLLEALYELLRSFFLLRFALCFAPFSHLPW